ncbi:MAG: DNA polymerase III subunit delta, partial [Propionibacterium sp.]
MTVFGKCLLIYGPEQMIAERNANQRVANAVAERPDAQVNRMAAGDLDGNQLAEVTGGSLFALDTVTVITDIGSTPPELFDAVYESAVKPTDDLSLVLIHGGGVKGKKLLDKLKKAKIEKVEAAAVKPWQLVNFVATEANRLKVPVSKEAAQALVDAVGSDLRSLVAALDQLRSDADGNEITPTVIQRYFSGRAEVNSFAVSEAVLAGKLNIALERLRWALATGVPPILVTAALASGLRGLGKYLDYRGQHANDYELARIIGVPPFKV